MPAIEEAIFAGVPVNVTLLFSREQYHRGGRSLSARRRAAHRGRAQSGRRLGRLGVRQPLGRRGRGQGPGRTDAIGSVSPSPSAPTRRICELLASPRWQRAANAGARAQRLLWASTGTKDPKASDMLYVKALAAPFTVNTMPEGTLKAFADHGEVGELLAAGRRRLREQCWRGFAKAGIDVDALAAQLQDEGAQSFVKSWNDLMAVHRIQERRDAQGELIAWQSRPVGASEHPSPHERRNRRACRPCASAPPGASLEKHYQKMKRRPPAATLCRRPRTRRALDGRSGGTLSRLFEEPDHR